MTIEQLKNEVKNPAEIAFEELKSLKDRGVIFDTYENLLKLVEHEPQNYCPDVNEPFVYNGKLYYPVRSSDTVKRTKEKYKKANLMLDYLKEKEYDRQLQEKLSNLLIR